MPKTREEKQKHFQELQSAMNKILGRMDLPLIDMASFKVFVLLYSSAVPVDLPRGPSQP